MFKKLLVGFSFLLAFLFIGFSVNSKSVGNSMAKMANDVLSQPVSTSITSPSNREVVGLGGKFSAVKTSLVNASLPAAAGSVKFDFDGDGRADVARWQAASTEWKVKNSLTGTYSTNLIGTASSVIAPADYDGDGKTDVAVFNPATATWTIKRSSNGTTQTITGFGQSGDKVVSGDYDGDGVAEAAVWRPSNATWYVKQSTNGATVPFQFGLSSDIAVPGNYDGDARMDYAVFRPSEGNWYVLPSATGGVTG